MASADRLREPSSVPSILYQYVILPTEIPGQNPTPNFGLNKYPQGVMG